MTETIETLSTDEIDKLLNYVGPSSLKPESQECDSRNYTMILLMLDSGLRVGELVKLLNSDLYCNSIPVTSIIVRAEIAKNHRERQIPVSVRLTEALYSLQRHYSSHSPDSPKWPAFHTRLPYCSITIRHVQRIIRSLSHKALGRQIHPHILRHTFATRLMRVTSLSVVQQLLGHKSVTSTQIYLHPNSVDLTDAVNKMDKLTDI